MAIQITNPDQNSHTKRTLVVAFSATFGALFVILIIICVIFIQRRVKQEQLLVHDSNSKDSEEEVNEQELFTQQQVNKNQFIITDTENEQNKQFGNEILAQTGSQGSNEFGIVSDDLGFEDEFNEEELDLQFQKDDLKFVTTSKNRQISNNPILGGSGQQEFQIRNDQGFVAHTGEEDDNTGDEDDDESNWKLFEDH
ncbi:proline-rich receptor-like protein kinase perk13-related [Anaeramoeba flamelloides]|uniref:Proline-rich receptor-like protein kinase perk13-related n=1 Tax=Anaeramoeba flamelloides TaxID=1746091 RepID=A0AAV7Z5U1_9EUKA|nr:proline-rich receptor-like protein kinase perk13-related [Anaeramoeba flamelloides]